MHNNDCPCINTIIQNIYKEVAYFSIPILLPGICMFVLLYVIVWGSVNWGENIG